jgi:hypothetical protein
MSLERETHSNLRWNTVHLEVLSGRSYAPSFFLEHNWKSSKCISSMVVRSYSVVTSTYLRYIRSALLDMLSTLQYVDDCAIHCAKLLVWVYPAVCCLRLAKILDMVRPTFPGAQCQEIIKGRRTNKKPAKTWRWRSMLAR